MLIAKCQRGTALFPKCGVCIAKCQRGTALLPKCGVCALAIQVLAVQEFSIVLAEGVCLLLALRRVVEQCE